MNAAETRASQSTKERLLALVAPIGQQHLLAFWDRLNAAEREQLARQIEAIEPAVLRELQEQRRTAVAAGLDESSRWAELSAKAQPPRAMRLDGSGVSFTKESSHRRGTELLRSGKAGVILVAGGLGTRLGFDQPKGMFPIGPLSNRPLFQVLFEQLLSLRRHYRARIPLYLMTSPATDEVTRQFLRDNSYFGLPAEDVRMFCQATMWALDDRGERILLETPGSLFLGPDGHGGMLAALAESGGLRQAQARGIEHFFYCQIDNPLTQICNEKLLGSHILAGSEMTTQVIRKRHPLERVGNVVSIDGRTQVIEYSDLPDEFARQTNPDGSLKLWAGNLAIHVIATEFLARCAKRSDALPFHTAHKKVTHLDSSGKVVEPVLPNALRFERFIFDLLPLARQALVVEADPAEAFAPVKNSNADRFDTPRTAKAAMIALHTRWLHEAGATVASGVPVEINPLWADGPDELRGRLQPGTVIEQPTYFAPTGPRTVELPPEEPVSVPPQKEPQRELPATATVPRARESAAKTAAEPAPKPTTASPKEDLLPSTSQPAATGQGLLHAVIMAGGSGTRFWPLSRNARPKQLLELAGGRTMIQATLDRLGDLVPAERTWVLTNRSLVAPIAGQLPRVARQRIVGEPCKRDTAPAVGLAALLVAQHDPEATLVVMPSDHLIQPNSALQAAIRQAVAIVEERPETLVTFGIKPTYPAEMFGYIERGSEFDVRSSKATSPAFSVLCFREKPARSIAEEYLAAGTFYWNSGIFVWKAKTILDALNRYEPEMLDHLQTIAQAVGRPNFDAVLDREFTAIRGKSIDFAVMEYYWPVAVIEAPFNWDDLGSWQALARSQGVDADGNTAFGRHLGIRTTGTIVHTSGEHLVVTLGLENTIVVHTADATLVADKGQEEEIRDVVKALTDRGWSEFL